MRTYQKKYLDDGNLNPRYRPYIQPNRRKYLDDGSLNPGFKPQIGDRHKSRKKLLPDGNLNPVYQPRQNKPGKHAYKPKRDFIAIDGEGVTLENGEHRYVLLVASTGEYIINPDGLSSQQCFDFLCDLAVQYPQGIFVCFGASYDVNQMLKDLPKDTLQALWAGRDRDPEHQSVNWYARNGQRYSLSYRPRKSFCVRRFGHPPFWPHIVCGWRDQTGYHQTRPRKAPTPAETRELHETIRERVRQEKGLSAGTCIMTTCKWEPNYVSMTLWDVFGFFQRSFVEALGSKKDGYFHDLIQQRDGDGQPHHILCFPDGLELDLTRMQDMKNRRKHFTLAELEQEILPYCRAEVEALRRLMNRLRDLLHEAGLSLSRWEGAGAAAAALLKREGVKAHMQEQKPAGLLEAQRSAYAGGRIELGQFGSYLGPVYNYDLNSAYPAAAMQLPSLTGGHWRKITGPSQQPYSLSYIRWQLDPDLPYLPFFYRDGNGAIYFPPEGAGWYWKPEVDAGLEAFRAGKLSTKQHRGGIEIVESWEFYPATDVKPFAFIQDLYEQRAAWKREGNAAQLALKLAINSLYGKSAQSLGGSEAQPPAYHNIGWAGYITSVTRARLFTAIMQAPASIIMLATDGIYSMTPLDLPVSKNLGEWELTEVDGIIAVQSGVYWGLRRLGREPTAEERAQPDFQERFLFWKKHWFAVNPHYRGFDKGSLTAADCLQAWQSWYKDRRKTAPSTFMVPATRFVTLGSALASDEHWSHWRAFRTITRELDLLPTKGKRWYMGMGKPAAHEGLYRTNASIPPNVFLHQHSSAYRPKWGDRQEMEQYVDGVKQEQVEMELWESNL